MNILKRGRVASEEDKLFVDSCICAYFKQIRFCRLADPVYFLWMLTFQPLRTSFFGVKAVYWVKIDVSPRQTRSDIFFQENCITKLPDIQVENFLAPARTATKPSIPYRSYPSMLSFPLNIYVFAGKAKNYFHNFSSEKSIEAMSLDLANSFVFCPATYVHEILFRTTD